MTKKTKKSINVVEVLKENYYFAIVLGVLLLCIIIVGISNNTLNKTEKQAYDVVYGIKNKFKNPEALKIIDIKLCNNEYAIIKASSTNSFGGIVTSDYYINKGTMSMNDDKSANGVVDKCFELEKNNYQSVHVLSKKSIAKINKKLKGSK